VFQYKGALAPPQRVARELGVGYVLEGSVRRAANRVRINAQLIDTATGFHLWAQRFDRDLEDIFALQDEIAQTIVAALEIQLTPHERASIAHRYTDNLEAYDLYLRARDHQMRRTREDAAKARETLERAVALDPNFAAAHALNAEIHRQEWMYEWRDPEGALDRAVELAQKAVRLDDQLAYAHMLLGWIHLWRKEHERAIDAARRSVELDPNNAEAWVRLGHALDFAGRPAEGIPLIEKAMRLDPHYPYIYRFWLGHAFQSLRRYDEAAAAYQRAIDLNPEFFGAHLHLVAAHHCRGDATQARAAAAAVIRLRPGFSIRREAAKLPYRDGATLLAPRRRLASGGPAGVRPAAPRRRR
jgi:adenylate cyclase